MDALLLIEIGKRIQDRRRQLGFTQEQLSEKMNVSIQMVSNLERGIKAIRIDNLIKLSRVLGISTDYILTGKESDAEMTELAERIACLPGSSREMIRILVDYCSNEKI